MNRFSKRSLQSLSQVHTDLVVVCTTGLLLSTIDFIVTEGGRSLDRQRELVRIGASRTMNSRHLVDLDGVCYAFDVAAWHAGEVRWDWPLYQQIADAMFAAAEHHGIKLEWGGNWTTFRDGPHFQLPKRQYPGRY